jgi:hypothetical protein
MARSFKLMDKSIVLGVNKRLKSIIKQPISLEYPGKNRAQDSGFSVFAGKGRLLWV